MVGRNQKRIALGVSLLVCIYFIVIFGEQAWRTNQLEADIAQQRASIADIRRENAVLATKAELLNSPAYPAYVERIARRDLGFARPGDTVLIVPRQAAIQPTPAPAVIAEAEPRQNWQRWIDAVLDPDSD